MSADLKKPELWNPESRLNDLYNCPALEFSRTGSLYFLWHVAVLSLEVLAEHLCQLVSCLIVSVLVFPGITRVQDLPWNVLDRLRYIEVEPVVVPEISILNGTVQGRCDHSACIAQLDPGACSV